MLLSFRKSLDKLSGKSIAITNSKLFKMLLMFGCGSLMGITFSPIGAWYFAWVALAPLWYLLCRDRNSGSVIYPLCWGIGCYGFALGWIFGIHPMTWLGVPFLASLSIAIFCLGFVTLWGGSLVILWSQLMRLINIKLNLNPLIRIILATAGWCGLETIYSWTDLWWTSLSLSQSPHNLAILHLGQLSGPNAVSAAIVFVNGLIAEAYLAYTQTDHQINQSQRERLALRYFSGAIAAILILHLVGWQLVDRPLLLNPKSAIEVGIIQGNIGNGIKHRRSGNELSIDNYTKGYRSLVEPVRIVLAAGPAW